MLTSILFIAVPTALSVLLLLLLIAKWAPPGGWLGDMPRCRRDLQHRRPAWQCCSHS